MTNDDFAAYTPGLPAGVSLNKTRTRIGTPDDGASVDKISKRGAGSTVISRQSPWVLCPGHGAGGRTLETGRSRWDRFEGTSRFLDGSGHALGQVTGTRSRSDGLWSKLAWVCCFSRIFSRLSTFPMERLSILRAMLTSTMPWVPICRRRKEPQHRAWAKFDSEEGNRVLRFALFRFDEVQRA